MDVESSITVLYVDDADAATVADRLERADDRLSVRHVTAAAAALDALDDGAVDCVVSAYRLPGTDGVELLEAVRDRHPILPFVLATARGSEAVASDAIAAGVTDYVRTEAEAPRYDALADRVVDAVERHRSERRVRSQHDQYRRLFEDAPVMYVVFRSVDDRPVIEDCNDRFLDRLGYHADEVFGRTVWDIYADESMSDVVEGFDRGRAGTFGHQERTLIDADGNRVHTLFRASPRVDESGEVIGSLGLYVDITERKRREKTLERLHEATRSLIRAESRAEVAEIITDGVRDVLGYPRNLVRLLDDHGTELRPTAITDEAERMLGERPVYPVGEGPVGRAFDAGETLVYDDIGAVDDGYERNDARASMYVPIGDHGVLCIGDTETGTFDESDRYLAEVFAANADSALTLLDRTRELERQNDRLSEFASVISHDLRTPLTVVDGRLELARERYDDDDLDRAAASLERAFQLIEKLLTLARQNGDLDLVSVDLRTTVQTCWQVVGAANATLRVEVEGTIRADETRLRQLFENLLRNCVEHGSTSSRPEADDGEEPRSSSNRPQAGDSVEHGSTGNRRAERAGDSVEHSSTGSRPQADDSVEHGSTGDWTESADGTAVTVTVGTLDDGFYVADDGPGVPDDVRAQVFEAGYSAGEGGTGLGLAIVKRIAEEHGWSVEVTESAAGGARFEITGVDVVD